MSADQPAAKCKATVRYGYMGRIQPRQCSFDAHQGSDYCGLHKRLNAKADITIISAPGGWCLWCAKPARRYESSLAPRHPIALCEQCAAGLARCIRLDQSEPLTPPYC